jgi:hypothetical protein
VPLVGAVLDLTANALPVRLEGVVALQNHLKAKAQRRVPDLLLSQDVDFPLDVLARNGGFDSLDPHEILVVERPQPVDRDVELPNLQL